MSEACKRRDLFGGLLRALARAIPEPGAPPPRPKRPAKAAPLRPTPPAPALPPVPIRPPGAIPEARFLDACSRCDDCVKACKPNVLLRLGPAYGKAEGTPGFFPDAAPCRLCTDLACAKACKTGALVTPARPEFARMGTAHVVPDRCLLGDGTPCDLCALACPSTVMAIRLGEKAPRVLADRCTGCGLCVDACPARPKALRIAPRP